MTKTLADIGATCETCLFWHRMDAAKGQCRRRAADPHPTSLMAPRATWHTTAATEGCGDHPAAVAYIGGLQPTKITVVLDGSELAREVTRNLPGPIQGRKGPHGEGRRS